MFGPGVAVPDPLEVLGGREREHPVAVADAEEGHLGPVEELLDDDPTVGLGEASAGVLDGGGPVVGDDDSLAGRQAVVLDDVRGAERVEGGLDLRDGGADVGEGRRDVGRRHDLLGEGLAPLEPGRLGARPEGGEAGRDERVGDPGDERRLRADDDEVDLVSPGHLEDRGGVGDPTRQRLAPRDGLDAGVAGCGDDGVDHGVGAETADEGVLTGPGTDDENLHGPTLGAGRAAPRPAPCGTRRSRGAGGVIPGNTALA